jgi:tRNA (guanine-N7-)-methyltransferase
MGKRIRRHADPFQCRIAISADGWLGPYRNHGGGDIWLDLGCGKGEFLAGMAARYPAIFLMGIEIRGKIVEAYFPKYKHLPNLLLLHGNVNISIPSMMDHLKVKKVFIHFPDPYTHKDRYKKRRMVNPGLVDGLCEILAPEGIVSVKTDDRILFAEMDALFSKRLEPLSERIPSQAGATVLSEWENDCKRKSMPVYSRQYRLLPEAEGQYRPSSEWSDFQES